MAKGMEATLVACFAAAMGMSGAAASPGTDLLGTWRVLLPREIREAAKRLHLPEPVAQLVLSPDQSFLYTCNLGGLARTIRGTFVPRERGAALVPAIAEEGWPAEGLIANLAPDSGSTLLVDGLEYSRGPVFDPVGTWVLAPEKGTPDATTRCVFDKAGNFAFKMSFGESKGTYKLEGWDLVLTYVESDGVPFQHPAVKRIRLGSESDVFLIDSFRYLKADSLVASAPK